jgi:hypothetical protein
MAYKLPVGKQITVKIAYVDAGGNPATVDGPVKWGCSNAEITLVGASGQDSTQAYIAGLTAGDSQVNATADADLGDGTRELVTFFDVTVIGAEAVAGTISPVGEPIDTPEVTPQRR